MRNSLLVVLLLLSVPAVGRAQYETYQPGTYQLAQPEQQPAERGTRLRLGVDHFLNAGTNGSNFMVGFVAHLRVGAQLDDTWAIYYQAAGMAAGSLSLYGGNDGLFLHTSSVMAEVTFGDLFQLGLGPSVGVGTQHFNSGGNDEVVVGGGGSLRAAFTFGGMGPGRRSGFSIGAQTDVVAMNAGNVVWMAGVTLGWETF